MGLFGAISREANYIANLLRVLGRIKKVQKDPDLLVADALEEAADRHSDRPAFIDDDEKWTYADFDAYANRVAHWALDQGLKAGDTVAVFMQNRIEYVGIWYGLSKVGVVSALLNNQIFGASLAHTLSISEADHIIIDAELAEAFASGEADAKKSFTKWGVRGEVAGAQSFEKALEPMSEARPDRSHRDGVKQGDMVLKMFTSGTTGMPKAAKMTHTRVIYYMNVFSTAARTNDEDRVLMVLPLYHATGGLCGVGAALNRGGAVIVRKKFSASQFWAEAKKFHATIFIYVGELCRFLMAQEPNKAEKDHSIRCAIGNGLRPDVWKRFVERTDIEFIIEFYGSTEGNVSLINIGGRAGSIGRIAPYVKSRFNVELIKHDVESGKPVRGEDGFCIAVEPDEAGEAIGKISKDDPRFRFEGYGSKEDTEKKILHDVFEKGDAWFRTGDLMKRDSLGYYYFIDRIGDTYRWKAENIATSEVEEAIGVLESVDQAIVYGVEVDDYDGRAGMAALVTDSSFTLDDLSSRVADDLPDYARPVFVRLMEASDTTGTFKYRKKDLKEDGFDPDKIKEPLFYLDPETRRYEPLDALAYESIQKGRIRL